MTKRINSIFVGLFVLVTAAAAAMSVASTGGQLTGGGGLTRVITNDSRFTGSGTSGNPLALNVAGTAGRIIGTGSAGSRFDLATTAVTPGTYTTTTLTVDAFGRLTAASSGASGVPTSRQILAGTGLSGGGDLSADRTLNLANTAVAAGSYTLTNLTVDAQGRLTAASSGALFAGAGQFGDGSDGSASLSGAQTITRDQFYTTLTLASGTTLSCTSGRGSCRIFASVGIEVTSGTATIQTPGLAAVTNTAGGALTLGPTGANAGAGASGIQNAGQAASNFSGNWPTSFRAGVGGAGGAGIPGGAGGAGASASTLLTDDLGSVNTWAQAQLGAFTLSNPGRISGGGGGGSGGGTTGVCSGGGGGGGGGVIIVGTRTITGAGSLVVTAPGGAGGATTGGGGCNGGGGGGGGGGYAIVGYGGATQPGSLTVSAPGGAAGPGSGTGSNGSAGNAGKTLFFGLGPS